MMQIEPHKIPLPEEVEGIPSLPREVRLALLSVFLGFWIPIIPQIYSIRFGIRIFRITANPEGRFTGRSFGYFAVGFAIFQLLFWAYVALAMSGILPPPASPKGPVYY